MTVCWHDDGRGHPECPVDGPDRMLFVYGRCHSGQRWFWAGECYDGRGSGEVVTVHGWSATEDEALRAARSAIESAAAGRPATAYVRQGVAARVLKAVNAAKRNARPPKPGAKRAAPVEYLYEPWSWTDDYGETHKGIGEIPIVKKTAKRIYYDNSDRWDRTEGVVTFGYISREEFETDTRCRAACPRIIPAGLVCGPHARSWLHCVHWGGSLADVSPGCIGRGGCGDDCPADKPGVHCAEHGYTWDHCTHGRTLGDCYHGSPAGQADLPASGSHYGGGNVYASREAAEEYLYQWGREQGRKRQERGPELKRLKQEMADAHPDRGGTDDEFMAARQRYKRALRQAS